MYTDYEEFTNDIPDSDAKIYMTLDDIIEMEGIKKPPRPGSVKSVMSRRSARSNKSIRSTYSKKSHKSLYSNTSYKSTSKRLFRANSRYDQDLGFSIVRTVYNDIADMSATNNFVKLRKPGQYIPTNQNLRFYKNKVRQAVKKLSGSFIRPKSQFTMLNSFGTPEKRYKQVFRKTFAGRNSSLSIMSNGGITRLRRMGQSGGGVQFRHYNGRKNSSFRRIAPLTKTSLATFNRMQPNKSVLAATSIRSGHSCNSKMSHKRHSVHDFDMQIQKELQKLSKQTPRSEEEVNDMDFVPTPSTTGVTINERMSHYD